MENQSLSQFHHLLTNLTITKNEPEPYILTSDEEKSAIEHEIESGKKFKAWRLAQQGVSQMEILKKLSEIDFEKIIDREDILQRANSNKLYAKWQADQRIIEKEIIAEQRAALKKRCDAKYVFRTISWVSQHGYDKKLILNDQNRHLIIAICYFLGEDERFEKELGFSFKKGLLIRGTCGVGKTYLLKCARYNELNPIAIVSAIEIAEAVKENGEFEIQSSGCSKIFIDDVGSEEPIVNHYGTKINWVKNFLEKIYLRKDRYNNLIISTNNNFSELEAQYGFRVRSRLNDMFNVIDIVGEDMRGS